MKRNSPKTAGTAPTPTPRTLVLAVLLVCSASLFAQMPAHVPAAPDLKQAVARVNGVEIITSALIDESENLYPSNSAHGGIRPEKLKEVRKQALDELIIQELVLQEAKRTGATVPMSAVKLEYRRLQKKFGARRLADSIAENGLTVPEYQKLLQRRMTLAAMFKKHVVQPSRMTPAELRAYYTKNKHKFARPEQVKARLILAEVQDFAKPEQERAAREKINKVHSELKAGKDFAALAQQYSDDFYKVKGGDLGWTHKGRLEPAFEAVAFKLKAGEFSEPFKTPYGYNIIKVEAREPATQMTFAQVRKVLKYDLEQKRIVERRSAWTAELKKNAKVEILVPELRAAR